MVIFWWFGVLSEDRDFFCRIHIPLLWLYINGCYYHLGFLNISRARVMCLACNDLRHFSVRECHFLCAHWTPPRIPRVRLTITCTVWFFPVLSQYIIIWNVYYHYFGIYSSKSWDSPNQLVTQICYALCVKWTNVNFPTVFFSHSLHIPISSQFFLHYLHLCILTMVSKRSDR